MLSGAVVLSRYLGCVSGRIWILTGFEFRIDFEYLTEILIEFLTEILTEIPTDFQFSNEFFESN